MKQAQERPGGSKTDIRPDLDKPPGKGEENRGHFQVLDVARMGRGGVVAGMEYLLMPVAIGESNGLRGDVSGQLSQSYVGWGPESHSLSPQP